MQKKVSSAIKEVAETITGIIPNLLNITVKLEGAEWDPKNKNICVEEINIDFNLGNKK